jgi:hypothetical protein
MTNPEPPRPTPRLQRLLFPDPARDLPAERAIRIGLRTAHIAAFGILLGGHVFDVERHRLLLWLWLTIGTGGALVAVELCGSFVWLLEVRGWMTLLKLVLIWLVPWLWPYRVWLLLATLVIGSVSSHMPGRFRYYSVFHRGVVGEERRG